MKPQKVILLGVDTPIGLAIIREMAHHNVEVIGLGRSDNAIGAHSNKLTAFYRRKDSAQLVEQILHISHHHNAHALLAISEHDIEFLNEHRDILGDITLLIPPKSLMDKVLNKDITYQEASKIGIDVPNTVQITQLDQVAKLGAQLSFPVILKWANPQLIIKTLEANQIEFCKLEYAENPEQLAHKLERYSGINQFPIIQEYCRGVGLGQFFLMHEGRVVQRFQHQRIHEWPPEGGTSTLCKSIPMDDNTELLKKSEKLLSALSWEGVAMVEYRLDRVTNKAYLMEINGRFWGSYPLAQQAGADFAWLLLAVNTLKTTPSIPTPRARIKCCFLFPELRRLFRVVAQPARITDLRYKNSPLTDIWTFVRCLIDPRTTYFVFTRHDPKPFLKDISSACRRALKLER